MTVAIVDYGSGNLHSAEKAFVRGARAAKRTPRVLVTADPDEVAAADRVVLPGVGAFADCRRGLFAVSGMVAAIEEAVRARGRPFLGICVGMQLLATRGLEHGTTPGLDWIAGEVRAIKPVDASVKVPHMGWNDVALTPHAEEDPVIDTGEAYFLHSYHFHTDSGRDVIAMTDHGGGLVAAVGRDNLLGVQFHPEKSQAYGLALLERFLAWRP